MKIAFVHDWIVHLGGAEMVLQNLTSKEDFADAKVFVLYSTQKFFQIDEKTKFEIVTALPSRINSIFTYFAKHKTPVLSTLFDYRNLMFWFPLLCRLLRRKVQNYQPDSVTISSFAAVKNIVKPESSSFKNVTLYLHSPMQYIRENYEENITKLKTPIKRFYQFATKYLRPWDKKYRRYDNVMCNSHYTAELAKQLYNIDGQVVYPPVDKAFIDEPIVTTPKEYMIFVGRVQKYVREIDKVIELCNATNTPLLVLGSGPDMDFAKSLAGGCVIFLGHISDTHEKIAIMKHAKGLINLAKESFGIGTMEALSLGVPVFGYNRGATPELVDTQSGILVDNKEKKPLEEAFSRFLTTDFDREHIAERARKIV